MRLWCDMNTSLYSCIFKTLFALMLGFGIESIGMKVDTYNNVIIALYPLPSLFVHKKLKCFLRNIIYKFYKRVYIPSHHHSHRRNFNKQLIVGRCTRTHIPSLSLPSRIKDCIPAIFKCIVVFLMTMIFTNHKRWWRLSIHQ